MMEETITRMMNVYKEQVDKLKEDWKSGKSSHCEKTYKFQLGIWEKRIKQYEEMLNKN